MTKYKFTCDIEGANNGYTITRYTKGQEIEQNEICEYLFSCWTKSGVLEELKADKKTDKEQKKEDKKNKNVDNKNKKEDKKADKDGKKEEPKEDNQEQIDAFLNGETDELPEGTQEITKEEAEKLEENAKTLEK